MESGPIFTDSSGRRRRAMRLAGLGAAAVLAVCLGAVVMAMTGGPQAPFTHWAVQQPPQAAATGNASQQAKGGSRDAGRTPGAGTTSDVPSQGASAPAASPSAGSSPSAGASPTAGPSASTTTSSPPPTNPAGKTPPGHNKSPDPRKSASVA